MINNMAVFYFTMEVNIIPVFVGNFIVSFWHHIIIFPPSHSFWEDTTMIVESALAHYFQQACCVLDVIGIPCLEFVLGALSSMVSFVLVPGNTNLIGGHLSPRFTNIFLCSGGDTRLGCYNLSFFLFNGLSIVSIFNKFPSTSSIRLRLLSGWGSFDSIIGCGDKHK